MIKRQTLYRLILLLVVILVAIELAGAFLLPDLLSDKAKQFLNKKWPGKYVLGSCNVHLLLGGRVSFDNVILLSPSKPEKQLIKISNLRVNVGLMAWLTGRTVFDEIRTSGMTVDLERLEDETFASLPSPESLFDFLGILLPSSPMIGARAYADSVAERVSIRRVRLLDTQFRYTDHHTHQVPAVAEITPLNIEMDDLVYPLQAGESPGQYRITGKIPSPHPGELEFSGDVFLFETEPSFTVKGRVTELDAVYAGAFIPDDVDIKVLGGVLALSAQGNCDRGHLVGTWAVKFRDLDADVNGPLFEQDIKITRDMVRILGKNYELSDIPFDCHIYNPDVELQECIYDGLDNKMHELLPVFDRMSREGKSLEDVANSVGSMIETFGDLLKKKEQ